VGASGARKPALPKSIRIPDAKFGPDPLKTVPCVRYKETDRLSDSVLYTYDF